MYMHCSTECKFNEKLSTEIVDYINRYHQTNQEFASENQRLKQQKQLQRNDVLKLAHKMDFLRGLDGTRSPSQTQKQLQRNDVLKLAHKMDFLGGLDPRSPSQTVFFFFFFRKEKFYY